MGSIRLNVKTSPPFNRLPSDDDVPDLPVWGTVAVIARILERVEPLTLVGFYHYPKECLSCIRQVRIWMAKNAALAGNAPALNIADDIARQARSIAPEVSTAVQCIPMAAQSKMRELGTHMLSAARDATLRLEICHDHLGAEVLVDCILTDVDTVREWSSNGRISIDSPIAPKELGPLWPAGEPARVFEDRLRIFFQKQGMKAFRTDLDHADEGGYARSILDWLPLYAAMAFCIRSLWALYHIGFSSQRVAFKSW